MATFASPSHFAAAIDKFGRDLESQAWRAVKNDAEKAAEIARREISRDVGSDVTMSNWPRRARPQSLDLKVQRLVTVDGYAMRPMTRSGAGGWTLAERGRNQGNVNREFGPSAPTYTKTGKVRKRRARQSRRWSGRTSGWRTASRAIAQFPKRSMAVALKAAQRGEFD